MKVCQNNANKSDNFSREIEVCQNNVNKSEGKLVLYYSKTRDKNKFDHFDASAAFLASSASFSAASNLAINGSISAAVKM